MLFCLLFLLIDLYFLIPAIIAQMFNPIAELVIPTGRPIKEKNRYGSTSSNCRT